MLYVPEGFAHGFQTLEDDTEVSYQISEFYVPIGRAWGALGRPRVRHRVAAGGADSQRARPLVSGLHQSRGWRAMSVGRALAGANREALGRELHDRVADIYPICRSITGDGVRGTLARLAKDVPLSVHEVPTGAQVLDWTVPREWNIRDAYVRVPGGPRVIDFRQSNLHVVGYSVPVRARMSLEELRPHLFSIPDRPDWIPYRTSYYQESWGFCVSQRQLEGLEDREYEVCIDSSLEPGHLTYGEYCIPGASEDEILVSTHICHPSLANDNAAGLSVAVQLAKHLADLPLRYTYRFLFIPGTIGAITWLA